LPGGFAIAGKDLLTAFEAAPELTVARHMRMGLAQFDEGIVCQQGEAAFERAVADRLGVAVNQVGNSGAVLDRGDATFQVELL
jgi:hypothetical protein